MHRGSCRLTGMSGDWEGVRCSEAMERGNDRHVIENDGTDRKHLSPERPVAVWDIGGLAWYMGENGRYLELCGAA